LNKNARTPNTGGAGFVYNSSKYDTVSTESVSIPWEGWRSNLKPAAESWILVRKPLEGNVAENILAHGTGGVFVGKKNVDKIQSNVVLSHDQECTKRKCIRGCLIRKLLKQNPNALKYFRVLQPNPERHGTPFLVDDKIGRKERGNLRHPTIKTQKLMEFLVGLVTPPGGVVLDPFTGSGSTAVAAISLGQGFYGVEKDDTHFNEARQRIDNVVNTVKSRK
jgi:site-specific DNA-methyltransferase (adenine-specific)